MTTSLRLDPTVQSLLQQAKLKIWLFDTHRRTDMRTFGRTRPCYIMSYHKSGKSILKVGDQVHELKPGMVVLIPPNVKHDHYKLSNDLTVFLWWHFTYSIGDTVDALRLIKFPYVFDVSDMERFEQVFSQFTQASAEANDFPNMILRESKALELLYILLDSAMKDPRTTTTFGEESMPFYTILEDIIKNPGKRISLEELARQHHLHATYISNRFRKLFGKPLSQIQREFRVAKAEQLLSSTDSSVREIAETAGFYGYQNLSKVFKEETGLTPSQFRKTVQRREAAVEIRDSGQAGTGP
jgi:AraC family transcriptional regulator of arabinose operon